MANTKGARKAARQAEKRRKHNASLRSALTSAIKSVTQAIAAGDKAAARKIFSEASGIMDRIADKNVVHKNEAARHKSRLAARLNAAARSLDNPLGITFSGVTTAREALAAIEEDGDLQAVVVDDKLYTLNQKSPKKEMSALELVQRVTRFRPELDVYILIAQEHEDEIVDALFAEAVDGYFYREERDYRGMYRILNAQIQERSRTPFYDQLKNYVWMAKDSWHTPGHSSGESLRGSPWVNDFCEFMGEHVFDADLSVSVKMLDSLMEPTGVIAEAQTIAAKAFGARR